MAEMRVTVKYSDLYEALKPLVGLRLRGAIHGPPTSKFPLRELADRYLRGNALGVEEYRGVTVLGVEVAKGLHVICHFSGEEPDDFCIALEGENPWAVVTDAAHRLSKLTGGSYTLMLSSLVHAIHGIIAGEEEEVEEITDPDQVVEELLTWLPEYVSVVD